MPLPSVCLGLPTASALWSTAGSLGFFFNFFYFLALGLGENYKMKGKLRQCLELDWTGMFDSYLGPGWII